MVTTTASKKAVGYFRVSSPGQTGERHSSLEIQEKHFREYCQRSGLTPTATFTDVVTGRRDDRKEYQRMVELARQDHIDVIVVQFLDRFGRNPREILQRYWELEAHGVSVMATDEDIKEELVLLLKAGIAGAESRRTSERVRANMGTAVSKGVHVGRPPYGLRPIKEVTEGKVVMHWEIDPEEAPVVREMYRLAVEENLGHKAIADRLTAKGYRAHEGRPFAAFTVQRVLTNPAIMGTLIFGRRPRKGNPQMDLVDVPSFFPAILSVDEWQHLQQRLNIRRENPKGKTHSSLYLLSGIARCGHCGGPMSGTVGASRKGKRYRNYYCSRAMHSKGLCSVYNGHSAPRLEKAILEYLGQFSDPEKVREHLVAAERKELVQREAELRDVEKRLADLEAQFLHRLDDLLKRGVLSEEEFGRANQTAREQKRELEARQTELSHWLKQEHDRASLIEQLPRAITTFVDAFQAMDVRQQKAQLQTILKAAYVYNDGRIELEFRGEKAESNST
jgi:site-specific DNA recombinase